MLALLAALGWYGYSRYGKQVAQIQAVKIAPAAAAVVDSVQRAPSTLFTCDGRKHCSQMTSCNEAKLFLKNCPGMEMDGNHDGVPCEQQCAHRRWLSDGDARGGNFDRFER